MVCHGPLLVGYWAVRVILTPSTAHGVLERELQLFTAMQKVIVGSSSLQLRKVDLIIDFFGSAGSEEAKVTNALHNASGITAAVAHI
ncbi:hypothetical protein M5K25_025590 [Dendrobium thyrsiflorum]|uniref:Uncharacterized protein n=1 Tax=Dendrobium thyrsiflorum TaxID=117978 RepID=A0ABD0U4D2_DENTH